MKQGMTMTKSTPLPEDRAVAAASAGITSMNLRLRGAGPLGSVLLEL